MLKKLFTDGGTTMFVVVAFGLVVLATAAFYAARPDSKHEGFLKWMSAGTLWSILMGCASGLATTLQAAVHIEDPNLRSIIVMQGISESLSPAIMGFAFLALAAMLTAVGRRRLDGRRAA